MKRNTAHKLIVHQGRKMGNGISREVGGQVEYFFYCRYVDRCIIDQVILFLVQAVQTKPEKEFSGTFFEKTAVVATTIRDQADGDLVQVVHTHFRRTADVGKGIPPCGAALCIKRVEEIDCVATFGAVGGGNLEQLLLDRSVL